MADETTLPPPQQPQPPKNRLTPSQLVEITTTADEICAKLHERTKEARWQIRQLTTLRGPEFSRQLLQETLDVEAQGGLPSSRGGRRTPGGVFLRLARQYLTAGEVAVIFTHIPKDVTYFRPPRNKPGQLVEGGAAFKATIIGRPIKALRMPECAALEFETAGTMPPLPRGLPTPPGAIACTVYVSLKHWPKVEDQLQRFPDDAAIINGVVTRNPDTGEILVFAINATTKFLQAERQAEQKAAKPQPPVG